MTRQDIVVKLNEICAKVFKIEHFKVSDEMSAETLEQWTSLSFMILLSEIEQAFSFKFKMMELLKLKTMGDIISAIEYHCS